MQTFYSHGKLLISAEYAVLDGALALALPTKFGQSLQVESTPNQKIVWKSISNKGEVSGLFVLEFWLLQSYKKMITLVCMGGFEVFEVFESQILNIELSKKYPTIKSYVGKSTQSAATVRFSYSPSQGFNAALSNNKSATVLIKPSDLKNERYRSYSRKDIIEESNFECNTIEKLKENTRNLSSSSNRVSNDGFLRKYRLAVATTAEYSNYFLDGTEVDDTERKTKVLAAINASLTRINGIFERDFAITMELVSNTDSTIFLNPSSDPFNGDFNSELQNTLDSTIGDSNYDVGHLFGYEGSTYGSAGCIACVCTSACIYRKWRV